MAVTDDLVVVMGRLRTDAALQASFRANPGTAVENFALTAHERDALVTRDLDDFVALGVVGSIAELPAVLRGEPATGSWITNLWLRLKLELQRLTQRGPRPQVDPRPRPRPGPDPIPDPRPGPDPTPEPGPGPDPRPGPERR